MNLLFLLRINHLYKVGRTPNGKDIILEIVLPSNYYPFVKPHVLVRTPIKHPNLDDDGILSLQLLEEWTPVYRLKHVIGAARRLFLNSKQLIVEKNQLIRKELRRNMIHYKIGLKRWNRE